MTDYQFYPTPESLAEKAWGFFKSQDFEAVLEPSAGKGDLFAAKMERSRRNISIDCIEIDAAMHPILREKGAKVVALDFLKFRGGSRYSHVIMNPPFAEGAKHVLHAWDILFHGEIVAILNAETVKNPFSAERQRLLKLIEQHGRMEFVGQAFMEAERKTEVETVIIHLEKKADGSVFSASWMQDLKQDKNPADGLHFEERNELAHLNGKVDNMVAAFRAAVKAASEQAQASAKASYYSSMLGAALEERNPFQPTSGSTPEERSIEHIRNSFRESYKNLKERAWASILRSTDVSSKLSVKARQELEKRFNEVSELEFTKENIYGFLQGLSENLGSIQESMILDVFDMISRYHTDNTHFYRGWKSNDQHRTAGMKIKAKRFILPGFNTTPYQRGFGWSDQEQLRDIDRAFAMLDGGKLKPEVGLYDVAQDIKSLRDGERVQTTYFDIRYYKGIGTIHFFPRSEEIMDRMNRAVGRLRKWLPPTDCMGSDAYWDHYQKADKLDKELVQRAGSEWGSPLRRAGFKSGQGKEDALEEIGAILDDILAERGIDIDAMLKPAEGANLLSAA